MNTTYLYVNITSSASSVMYDLLLLSFYGIVGHLKANR